MHYIFTGSIYVQFIVRANISVRMSWVAESFIMGDKCEMNGILVIIK